MWCIAICLVLVLVAVVVVVVLCKPVYDFCSPTVNTHVFRRGSSRAVPVTDLKITG